MHYVKFQLKVDEPTSVSSCCFLSPPLPPLLLVTSIYSSPLRNQYVRHSAIIRNIIAEWQDDVRWPR